MGYEGCWQLFARQYLQALNDYVPFYGLVYKIVQKYPTPQGIWH